MQVFAQYENTRLSDSLPNSGNIFGQTSPGNVAEIFAPNLISFGFHEHKITISPDGKEFFYVMSDSRASHYKIIRVLYMDGLWLKPEVASFSGQYSDIAPTFTPDGKYVLFASSRPVHHPADSSGLQKIWIVEKVDDNWSEPKYIPIAECDQHITINPTISSKGNLYFQANFGNEWNIYVSKIEDDGYSEPYKLNNPVNTEYNEGGPCVSADESYLLFHSDRPGGFGKSDLYISFRKDDETWSNPQNLGESVNSSESDTGPFVTFDGKYLFFSSFRTFESGSFIGKSYDESMMMYNDPRNGTSSIYWVNAEFINDLKINALSK